MSEHKKFKIDEPVYVCIGEDALYVGTDKYIPEKTCRVIEWEGTCECSNCRSVLWNGNYVVEYANHFPKYCKWCGAKIDGTEQEDVPF